MPNKILLVDDDREFRSELRECLEEYDVAEAGNGEDAIRILKKPNDIDLVVLDVRMPGMSGTDVLKEIKEIAPDTGVIMLTGNSSEDVAIEALKGHADDYVEKPFNIEKVKEIIANLLDAKDKRDNVTTCDIKGKIEKVKRFVERNCYKKTTLEDAAGAACLSPKYLSRIFMKSAGIGFSEYKLKIKMEKAKELLTEAGYNVNQAAYKLGYENAESFTRQFKKLTGYSPSEYREKIKRKDKRKKRKKSR